MWEIGCDCTVVEKLPILLRHNKYGSVVLWGASCSDQSSPGTYSQRESVRGKAAQEPLLTWPKLDVVIICNLSDKNKSRTAQYSGISQKSPGFLMEDWNTENMLWHYGFDVTFDIRKINSGLGNLQWPRNSLKWDLKFSWYGLRKCCPLNPGPVLCNSHKPG